MRRNVVRKTLRNDVEYFNGTWIISTAPSGGYWVSLKLR